MGIKFANNVKTTLAANINAVTTSIEVVSTSGFPTLGVGDYFYATIAPASELDGSAREIVKVSSYTGTTCTVTRAQDGTSAASWSATDKFEIRVCNAALATAVTAGTDAEASATAAAASASAASTSASDASTSATNAASSATSAAASYDLFDDRFLGAKSSDPTLDNDGNALQTGALYWNTVSTEMRTYDGAAWIPMTRPGKQTIWIPALALVQRTTNGPASGVVETTTNKIMVRTLDFDASTIEYAQIQVRMPKGWNEGTLTSKFLWSNASGTGDVIWGIQAVALSDDDVLDAAFGTAVEVTDSVTAAGDLMQSTETASLTVAGTPQAEDLVVFQVYRKASDAGDTLAVDARLHGVCIFYTTDAANDA